MGEAGTEEGWEAFLDYCAVCHGIDGQGNGPLAGELTKKPADLTRLAERNGGEFPFWRVYTTIDGRELSGAHGTREMPVWGFFWKYEDPEFSSDTYTRGRILELMLYLRSIQLSER
jgi:mono/diheme cytochrome c family protein